MEEDIILEYHPLILGVLKKCHIYPHHPDFEDYLQSGRIELILLHREYKQQTHLKQPPFAPFAYQKIYWRTLDLVRKNRKYLDDNSLDDTMLDVYTPHDYEATPHDYSQTQDTYQILCQSLSPLEKAVLCDRLFYQLNVTQIASKQQVSRKTIYQVIRSIQKKYLKIEKNR